LLAVLLRPVGFVAIPAVQSSRGFSYYRQENTGAFSEVVFFIWIWEETALAPRVFFIVCVVAFRETLEQATVAAERNLTFSLGSEDTICIGPALGKQIVDSLATVLFHGNLVLC
jgi:hypothetical protein